MPKRPTLQDVADDVGLAPATVSYALRGHRGSDETVRKVQEAADRLGYHTDPIASALASGRTGTVAVLCGSTRDLWQRTLATDLARHLMARGRRALIADADGDGEREAELLDLLRQQRPDGIVVTPLDPFAEHWEDVAVDLPVLSVGDRLAGAPSAGAVLFDNAAGFATVFDHLADLGHERIAVVLTRRPSTPDRPGERLVAREAKRRGVAVSLVRTPPPTGDPDEMTDALADALFTGTERPTAAFCLSDSFAFGVLRAATRAGVRVPKELSVVGFENVEVADLVGPGLTTVDWGGGGVVDAVVDHLGNAIESDELPGVHTIAPMLVIRGTTAAPNRSS